MGKKQRNRRAIGEQGKIFSPAPYLVGFAGTVLKRKLKPLRRSRSDKVREKALEQEYLEKSNSLACQLKSHGRLLDFIGELTCCSREDFCDSDVCQEFKEKHAKSSAVIKFLLEQLGYSIDVLSKQIRVSLHEMLCKDKKLEKVLKGDKQGGIFKGKTTHLNQVPSVQEEVTTSIDEFYQMFVHGIEADRPLVLTLKRDELGGALRKAVQKKCPNLPSSFILLHQGQKISVDHTLKEQGLSQDCNIHVHFGLCGGMEKEKDLDAKNGGEENNKAPQKWRKARVKKWIDEVCEEYEIEKDEVSELKTLAGAGLMKLKRQDWKERSPKQGDLLFNLWTELLQKTQKSGVDTTKSPPNSPRKGSAEEAATYDVASGGGQELRPRSLSASDGEQLVLGAGVGAGVGAVLCSSQKSDSHQTVEQGPFGPVENLDKNESYITVDDLSKRCPSDDELVAVRGICSSRPHNSGGAGSVLLRNDPLEGGTFLELKVDIRACPVSSILTKHVISTILNVKIGEQFFVRGKIQRLHKGLKSMKKGFEILPFKIVVDSDQHAAFRRDVKIQRSYQRQLSIPWPTLCGLFPAEGSTQEPLYQNDCLENRYGILFCPPDSSPEKIKESAIALKNSQTGDIFVGVNDDGTVVGSRVSRDAVIQKRDNLVRGLSGILPSTNESVSICTSAVQAHDFVEKNKDFVAAMLLQSSTATLSEDLEETEELAIVFRIHVVKGTSVVSFAKPEDTHAYIRVGTETKLVTDSGDLFSRLESLANRNIPEKTSTSINQEVDRASAYEVDEKDYLPLFKRVNFETDKKEFKVVFGEPTKIILKDYVKKYAASFLNSDGGDIYFGVEENRRTRMGNVVGVSISESDRKELLQESSKMICNFWPPVDSCQFFMKFIEVKSDVARNLIKYPKTHVDRAGTFVAVNLQDISNVPKLVNFAKTKNIDHFAVLRLENNRFGLLVKDTKKVNIENLLSEMESESNKSKYFKMDTAPAGDVEAALKHLCVVHLHVRASPYPIHLTSPFHTFCLDQQGVVTEMTPNQFFERFAKRRCQSDWPEKLLSATNKFEKENTSYVLICSPFSLPKEHRDLYGLVVPEWALVLDFDQAPNQQGHLLDIFKPLHNRHQVERNLFVKTPLDTRLDLNPRNGVCWCAVRGYEDIDSTLSKEDHASWLKTHGHKMRALIEKLIVHINPNQLVVVCLWDDGHKGLLPSLDTLLQLLFSFWGPTKAIFVCSSSSAKNDVLSSLVEPLEKAGFGVNNLKGDHIFVALPHELARHIAPELPPPYRSEDAFQIPRKIYTHELGERTLPDILPQTLRQAIKGHLQIMYLNAGSSHLSKPEDEDKLRVKFYSGSEIDEAGLAKAIAIERGKMKELKKEMKSFLNDKRSHVCLTILKAERGAGATTLCLQLLYEFHKHYVCARLLEFHDNLAANIEKINQHSQLPIILFVDSEMAYLPEFTDFKNEAERRKLNLKLLIVESDLLYSGTQMPSKKKQSIPYVVGAAAYKTVELSRELTSDETVHLVDQFLKIKEICQDKKTETKLKELKERVSQECSLRKFAIVSLTAFGRKFTGLKTYVKYRLTQANELQIQILEFLALIHVYTDFLFPVNALARLTTTDVVILERIFNNHDVRELLSPPSSPEKNVRRISFVEVAEEVLQQQAEKRSMSHTLYLKDVAVRLAKCALSGPRPSKRIDRITRRLYVTSEYGSEKFSPLVRYMKETDRDAAREMLHDLTEIFEKGSSVWAHLLAHLAKYYMIEYEDFPSAIPLIEEAVKENKDDVLLHHIHGDVIRLHIQNLKDRLDKEKVCLDEILRFAIKSSHCFVTVKEKRPLMEHGYSSDALIRKIVMSAAIKSVGGTRFVDFLRAFLAQRKGNESVTTFSPEEKYVLSLVPDWFANLQGVPINEFSAKLKDSLLECVGDLDELKVLCEDLKEVVKGTNDEAWVDKVALKTMSFICSLELERKPLQPEEADERIRSLEELLNKTGLDEDSLKMWIRCVRLGSKVPTLKEVRKQMDGWLKATGRRSPNALFYNYVVAILEALSDPNDTEKMKKAKECVKELQHKRRLPRSKVVSQDPSLPVEWLHPKKGRHINSLDALLHHEDLVRDYLKGATPKHEKRQGKEIIEKALFQENITKWEGVVSDISSDWKGSISLKKHINVSFVPVNVRPHMPNEGDEVRFCLAFHWTGPNAWSVVCQPAEDKNRKAVSRSALTFSTHREGDDSDSETSEKGDEEDLLPLVGESLHTQEVRQQEDMLVKEDEDHQWAKFLDQEMKGIILKRLPEKGFGYIYHPNFQSSLFFHAKQIVPPVDSLESIELYSVVLFTVGRSERGLRAMNIKIVEQENINDEKLRLCREELLQEQTTKVPISKASRRVVRMVELPKTLEDLYKMGSRQEGHIIKIPPYCKSLHGFIEIPSVSKKLFFQESLSGIQKREIGKYHEGAIVQFTVDKGPKGFFAKDVYIKPSETKQCQCRCGWEEFVGKGIQEGFVGVLKKESGYGFIYKDYSRERNPARLFFHESELKGCSIMQLNIGDRVHFVVDQNDKGCVARHIDLLSEKRQFVSQGNFPATSSTVVTQGSFQPTSASFGPRLFPEMFLVGPYSRPAQGQFSHMRFPPSSPPSRPPVRNPMPPHEEPWQYVTGRKRRENPM